LNTIPHPEILNGDRVYWPKYNAWAYTEEGAQGAKWLRQQIWARNNVSHYEGRVKYKMKISHARQRQYEAAMRILVTEKLNQ